MTKLVHLSAQEVDMYGKIKNSGPVVRYLSIAQLDFLTFSLSLTPVQVFFSWDHHVRTQELPLNYTRINTTKSNTTGASCTLAPGSPTWRSIFEKCSGGRFSKDPVTYRARNTILETMTRLPSKASILISFRYNETQNNSHFSKVETCS